jgi:PKD repeat protein
LAPAIAYSGGDAPVNAGTTTFTVTCGDGGVNYINVTAQNEIVISQAKATATATNGGGVYNGNPYTGKGTCSNNLTPAITYNTIDGKAPVNVGTTTFTVTCGDGNKNYENVTATGSITIIANDPPVITELLSDLALVPVNTPINFTAKFTDKDLLDTHSAVWTWGDGVTSNGTIPADDGRTVSGSHKYATPGIYTVKLTVTDSQGAFDTKSITYYIVIYDPNGGFVTGGGWIVSPAGAFVADPQAAGRANFGFVSKYQKGATAPSGHTEFQFQAGNLNFKSTKYEWLTIAGARAQYKGEGTINGTGNYKFILTAIDGQVNGGGGTDKFRIKITNAVTGAIVYDNQMGMGDDGNPTTVLGGGSIVIHSK